MDSRTREEIRDVEGILCTESDIEAARESCRRFDSGTVVAECSEAPPVYGERLHQTAQHPRELGPTDRDPKSRHYDAGGVEVQDVIKAKLTQEQYVGWLLGNVIKYSLRANFKDSRDRDFEKMSYYSKWLTGEGV